MAGRLGTRLSFYEVWTLSICFLISWDPISQVFQQLVRQLVYTIFVSNTRPSFDLWWKKNLVKHWKVSKRYEKGFLLNFLLLFMFLLTNKFFKNSHIQARILFVFLKNIVKQIWSSFNTKLEPHWNDQKSSYKVKKKLGFLPLNSDNFRSKECEKPESYQKVWMVQDWVRIKKSSAEKITHKMFETNSGFHLKCRATGKVQFLLFKSFLLVLTKLSFW